MPTKNVRKHTAIKTERPPEPISKRFIVVTDGYKRIIRKHKPNEPPYSNSYVAATIEADLFSAYHSLCHAVGTIKDSGLDKVYVDGNSPFSHTEAILRYSLILGYHMQYLCLPLFPYNKCYIYGTCLNSFFSFLSCMVCLN